jgi:hypothetical protein
MRLRFMNSELHLPLKGLIWSGMLGWGVTDADGLNGPMPDGRKSDETKPISWDKGWRIFGSRVSGKRTLFRGESRLIKANQSENGLRMGLRVSLGHEVGECGGGGFEGHGRWAITRISESHREALACWSAPSPPKHHRHLLGRANERVEAPFV